MQRALAITEDPPEADLIEAASQGDGEAFAALYDRHLQRVYSYVYHWVREKSDAEDLTQQVFLRAWEAIGRYRNTGAPFIAWLVVIAHNQVMSFYRKGRSEPLPERQELAANPHHNPEELALAYDSSLAIRKAILSLPPEQQQVIIMRFVEGFRHSQVGAVLGKSPGTIRIIQFRALAALRRALANEVESR